MDPIFIVDDEPHIRETLERILKDEGYPSHSCSDEHSLFDMLKTKKPSLVFLDIWLPGSDGMEILQRLKERIPEVPILMISGHAGIEAAVQAMKYGAYDFLEKPLDLDTLLEKLNKALPQAAQRFSNTATQPSSLVQASNTTPESTAILQSTKKLQKTIKKNVVLNGTGLLSGRNTGIILSPLEEGQGVVFQSLDGQTIPGHISAIENIQKNKGHQGFTANSTVLSSGGRRVRTVEHLLAALSMYEVHNVLIKVDEEIPNIDGSAESFCQLIEEAGTIEQSKPLNHVVIQKKLLLGEETPSEKHLCIEPFNGFEVEMRVDYPEPIFEQRYIFNPGKQSFKTDIAPARSFNTFENIHNAQQSGAVGGGYFNSHIIMHDGKVINTELRFPDEFVRHKILDLIGDLYLLGYPIQGRIFANMTSHGYNQALVYELYQALQN